MEDSYLFRLHEGLPRQGPGSTACTKKMFSMLPLLPDNPDILDIGCGSGMQTIDLARLNHSARVTALDIYPAFLSDVRTRAEIAGVSDRIIIVQASMDDMPFPPASFDLIWAEGSVFIIGVEQGIKSWKKYLKPGGFLSFTEAAWFTDTPSDTARAFWNENYPGIKTVSEIKELATDTGYSCIADFPLPASAWWDDYYMPLLARLPALEKEYHGDSDAETIIAITRKEIELYTEHSHEYGYQFFLLGNNR
jgi:SAM-dependent methyltransferase